MIKLYPVQIATRAGRHGDSEHVRLVLDMHKGEMDSDPQAETLLPRVALAAALSCPRDRRGGGRGK